MVYGMVWYHTITVIIYGMVWYGMVWYGMVWYGMVWCGVVWCGVVSYGLVGMVWYVVHRVECLTRIRHGSSSNLYVRLNWTSSFAFACSSSLSSSHNFDSQEKNNHRHRRSGIQRSCKEIIITCRDTKLWKKQTHMNHEDCRVW
mgnify:CR=1 FL=1